VGTGGGVATWCTGATGFFRTVATGAGSGVGLGAGAGSGAGATVVVDGGVPARAPGTPLNAARAEQTTTIRATE
jgi:hypothetical protein